MSSKPQLMAALGSSFAAGPGIRPIENRAAGRSARNYAHLVAAHYDARLIDATVSGATASTILTESQRTLRRRFPPQIESVTSDADLVTVTVGGNDLNFIGSLVSTAARRRGGLMGALLGTMPARTAVPDDTEIALVVERLAMIVAAVRERAPHARVVLVDYLTVLGPSSTDAIPLTASDLGLLLGTQHAIATAFERASADAGAELVRASTASLDHGLGSADPWVSGFATLRRGLTTSFHPNAEGMRRVADAVVDLIDA